VEWLSSGGLDGQELTLAAAAVKAGVVSRDPYEAGERRKLNLGHTFAHAIEHEARLRGDDITHGEAVAMGMILAARLSDALGVSTGLEASLTQDFTAAGLPTQCPYPPEALVEAMDKDKKAEGGLVHFVLPERIGSVIIRDLAVRDVVNYLKI
jgi:3-dehydroquinate synthetase